MASRRPGGTKGGQGLYYIAGIVTAVYVAYYVWTRMIKPVLHPKKNNRCERVAAEHPSKKGKPVRGGPSVKEVVPTVRVRAGEDAAVAREEVPDAFTEEKVGGFEVFLNVTEHDLGGALVKSVTALCQAAIARDPWEYVQGKSKTKMSVLADGDSCVGVVLYRQNRTWLTIGPVVALHGSPAVKGRLIQTIKAHSRTLHGVVHVETVIPTDADPLVWTQQGFTRSLVHDIFPLEDVLVLDSYLHNSSMKSRKDYCFTRRTKFTCDFLPLAQRRSRQVLSEAEVLEIEKRWSTRHKEKENAVTVVHTAAQAEEEKGSGDDAVSGESASEEESEEEAVESEEEVVESEEEAVESEEEAAESEGAAESEEEAAESEGAAESEEEAAESEEEGEAEPEGVESENNNEIRESALEEVTVNTPPAVELPIRQSPVQQRQSAARQSPVQQRQSAARQSPVQQRHSAARQSPIKKSPVESPENMSVSQEAMAQALPQDVKKTAPRRNFTTGWKPSLRV